MTSYRPLHDGWTVSGGNISGVPATVPGCVHTDLLRAGRIEDPYLDANETELAWIGRTDWEYSTSFTAAPGGRTDLVCAGLDTVAAVELNGVRVGETANMHRGYRFDVSSLLVDGENDLKIKFKSAYTYAEEQRDRLGPRPNAYDEPFNFIRKQACNFGWDWGPTLVTAGIWQPVGLETWATARLAEVRPQVTVAGGVGRVELRVRLDRLTDAPVKITASVAGRTAQATVTGIEALLILTVDDPELWWPRGYGDPLLYDLDVTLTAGDDQLDAWSRRVGFRDARVDTSDGGFTVVVNDVPVFVRGINWIPDDVFADRITRDRLAARFQQAADANVNYLRVWGGGRYESEDFYELADEMGFLVGQDFLFACAAYPEEEPFRSEVEAEARENVVRLASHPSLVVWTGNNENLWGHEDWDWKPALNGRTWGSGFYYDLLPRIVGELDPTRPYWPGSPYSGSPDRYPNDPAHGTTHIWDVWNTDDYTKYGAYRPRFVAEFGFQAPPTYATLRRSISDAVLAPGSPGMAHHQKAIGGDQKLERGLANHFPLPDDFDDWLYLTQLNQARALAFGIEHFRSLNPLCAGTIMWQLNDCWPVTSWAAVDGDGRKKPLWYALRDAYADRLLTFQPRTGSVLTAGGPLTDIEPGAVVPADGPPALVAVNDSRTSWTFETTVTRRNLAGDVLASTSVSATVAPGSAVTLPLPADVATPGDVSTELLATDTGTTWFWALDKDIPWPAAEFTTSVSRTGSGSTAVTVRATTILRSLTLFPDRLSPDAEPDRAGITVLPGESVTFTVSSPSPLDPEALTSRPVLRCVNDMSSPR
ncbi:glycoside hydrolase family 2 protein [Paractinoplanes brasiliensis]|uniref:beta-mannosidase n=1 Tax=Paractinoplanes brasiliensis TaxID=52695 RepID=A0A4R6JV20_9ACTN|nr:glycoside hydrolase family 2 protein [Actinoplanes brasiliensis]TDO40584.1 beta-mannosidase [Actinoplanes brasiliensis]GID25654.1 beta-mannosidase [Actinoplanes brasiliensis]